MKQYCYFVKFNTTQTEQVFAFCEAEAIILAQAKQIKKGNEYKHIKSVEIID